ncbi:hypothetical protein CFter6_5176 [Collimonas fungivorans]|uniref:Excinuclease ATPase subunit n=1 Tax=Collimonas fungivorans TaxID=158899 RepID=A0A127PIV2_9BURK|nr:hypothetical protein [Collimonas fungivorans]AMO97746.1 hypothetical protein CFter6_5176 [Collimonas fungivorans]
MNKFSKAHCLTLALACMFMCWQGAAQGRNTRLILPVSEVMPKNTAAQASQDPAEASDEGDMVIIFGAAAVPEGMKFVGEEILARGEIQPSFKHGYEDEVVCRRAFKRAMANLVLQARSRGSNAAVGIVSYYNHVNVMDSPTEFECHAGATRAVVDLKAKLARIEGLNNTAAAPKQD